MDLAVRASVPMERGARFVFFGSAPMQRGARFGIRKCYFYKVSFHETFIL
jgi:hypothetical protein